MTTIIEKVLSSTNHISSLVLRVPLGAILMGHGSQKLFAWFGGYGLEGTGQFMESVGFAPGYLMAMMAGSAEFFGGLALILGLLTRPAAFVVAFTMFMAMTVHIHNGMFLANNGYEFALILLAAAVTLVVQGAGKYSVDSIILKKVNG